MNTTEEFIGSRSSVIPTRLFAVEPGTRADEHPRAEELRRWTVEYLCQPHPDLGRPGPVCPYTGRAVAGRYLWAAFIDGDEIDRTFITAVVDDMNDLFPQLPPEHQPESGLKAVLSVFPDLTRYDDLEAVQHSQKTKFVRQGLMLGQFYPGCTVAGLHNPHFPALDSPLPLLAVRHMAPTDFAFLETRPEWVEPYLEIFAPDIPSFLSHYLAGKLVERHEGPPEN
ncbi:hypothetical protein KO481_33360 [Nocardia sp. NEAU-G5]|uniref:DUF6875 domain-containing protein n=1 Tax=Nocardia albiluteola TaxID=2842303 RepID=A0ABS6B7X8_9NOCA|nr:hypothetical protein [Nocardia albiluteola]MBU3066397.1 hypothetical protein [Nocardia albiluteola]